MEEFKCKITSKPRPAISFSLAQVFTSRSQRLDRQAKRRLHEIDRSLYQLAVLDYEAAKLAPVAFLPKQKAFLESELGLLRKEMEVRAVEGEI